MFKTEKSQLTFTKKLFHVGPSIDPYDTAPSSIYLAKLLELQKKYSFKVIDVDLEGISNKIIIKCNKEDKIKVWSEYCLELKDYIKDFKF